jgi:hypothetical protein
MRDGEGKVPTTGNMFYYVECQILFSWKENDLKRKYSLKLEAGIVSRTKSNNSLTNALVKHEAEHMPDIFDNERSNLKL